MEVGDIVKHKASGQQMIVVVTPKEDNHMYPKRVSCRYLNEVSGLYELQEFKEIELEKVDRASTNRRAA